MCQNQCVRYAHVRASASRARSVRFALVCVPVNTARPESRHPESDGRPVKAHDLQPGSNITENRRLMSNCILSGQSVRPDIRIHRTSSSLNLGRRPTRAPHKKLRRLTRPAAALQSVDPNDCHGRILGGWSNTSAAAISDWAVCPPAKEEKSHHPMAAFSKALPQPAAPTLAGTPASGLAQRAGTLQMSQPMLSITLRIALRHW